MENMQVYTTLPYPPPLYINICMYIYINVHYIIHVYKWLFYINSCLVAFTAYVLITDAIVSQCTFA